VPETLGSEGLGCVVASGYAVMFADSGMDKSQLWPEGTAGEGAGELDAVAVSLAAMLMVCLI
jgi:hypothetical protein